MRRSSAELRAPKEGIYNGTHTGLPPSGRLTTPLRFEVV
jgi:hypothetical protein